MGTMPEKYEQYIENENKVLSQFEKALSDSKLKLERNFKFRDQYLRLNEIDGLIKTEEGYPLVVIEIKLKANPNDPKVKGRLRENLSSIQAKYGVLTDGESYYILKSTDSDFKEVFFDDIINEIFNKNPRALKKKICDYLNKECRSLEFVFAEKDICFDENKYTLVETVERKFINKLFKFDDFIEPVYRYTTLNTVFEMLKNNSIRMMGIAGMNDISEVDYVENFLYPSPNVRPLSPEVNRIFITSCSDNKDDDLTQWRLYADDAKGIRLMLVPSMPLDAPKARSKFIIRSVKYLDVNTSTELILLKKLIDYVYRITGYTLIFSTFHEWCHFIKPKDYDVEAEVRVLYKLPKSKNSSGWLLANGINIMNPYMDFKLDQFPLKIENIKLGPKCPEKRMNQFQINTLAQEKTKLNVNANFVKESDIKNYR